MHTALPSCLTTQRLRGAWRRLVPALLAISFGGAAAEPAAYDDALTREFDEALTAYERNQWPEVYRAMSELARRGHPEAARIALQMWRYGPTLYGLTFSASAAEVEHWAQTWGCGGDAIGRGCELALRAP